MSRLSRRLFLGGGLVATGGGAAVAVGHDHRGRRWLHNAGLLGGPDAAVPDAAAPVEWNRLDSQAVRRSVTWGAYVPPGPQALVVCLHGRGADHTFAFDPMGVHRFVAARRLPWMVVSVDGGSSSYWHARADGTDASAMVFGELVPAARARGGLDPDVRVALLGWSMGGFGALLAACERPTEVAAVAASSPALWQRFADTPAGAFDGAGDFARHDVLGRATALAAVPTGVWCGTDDPFAGTSRALAQAAPQVTLHMGDGFHESATWRSFLGSQLDFLRGALDRAVARQPTATAPGTSK